MDPQGSTEDCLGVHKRFMGRFIPKKVFNVVLRQKLENNYFSCNKLMLICKMKWYSTLF